MGAALARLTWSELTPILALANRQKRLEIDDLPPVQPRAAAENVLIDFAGVWDKSRGWLGAHHPGVRFIRAVASHFKGLLAGVLALRVANDMLSFAGPLALEQIIGWLENPLQARPWWEPAGLPLRMRGVYYVGVMSVLSLVRTLMGVQEQALGITMGSQVSTWARAEIYTKALRQKTHVRAQVTSGQVINLMSMDAGFLREIPRQIPRIPRCIVKAGVGIALLVRLMGRGAVGAGVAVMLAFSPLGYLGISRLDMYADKYANKRDTRQGQMGELLSAIKLVKLNGWEDGMQKNILKTRREELDRMWMFQIADHFTGAVGRVLPVATVLATFGVYTWLGHSLTPQLTFTSLALLDEIRGPILSVGEVVADLVRGWTAICRVSEFLEAEELDEHAVRRLPSEPPQQEGSTSGMAIEISGGSFAWGVKPTLRLGDDSDDDSSGSDEEDEAGGANGGGSDGGSSDDDGASEDSDAAPKERVAFRLDSVELSVRTGSLVAIVGPVGSGKTSLLHALLGEMDCEGEPVTVRGDVAYAPQTPFVLNATLKENVGFGKNVDANKEHYDACLQACALLSDLKNMKKGDRTEIGESGETISGGQKQRLSLARAAFADAEIVLMDDVLSAVDAHVGAHIWEHCISDSGLMKGKTRVLVTHALQYISQCDAVFVMDKGVIVERGTLESLLSSKAPVLCSLMATYDENKELVKTVADSATATEEPSAVDSEGASPAGGEGDSNGDDEGSEQGEKDSGDDTSDGDSGSDSDGSSDDELTGEEERGKGDVKVGPIWKYVQAAGIPHSVGMLGFFVTDVGMQAISTYWLVWWGANRFVKPTSWYMRGMLTISLLEVAFIGGQQILRTFSSIRASVRLHNGMITSLLQSPLSFFHKTPQGRIMHRFGDALEEIDDCFHLDLFEMIENGIRAVGTICVCLLANPRFTAVLPVLTVVFWRIHTFTKTGFLEVDRLRESLYSPVMTHFGESLRGCTTIRAFTDSERFIQKSVSVTAIAPANFAFC
jgi:ABC-type multidrug transport system fused ATPase/permease subunit